MEHLYLPKDFILKFYNKQVFIFLIYHVKQQVGIHDYHVQRQLIQDDVNYENVVQENVKRMNLNVIYQYVMVKKYVFLFIIHHRI